MPIKIVTAAAVALAVVYPASAETRISVSRQADAKPATALATLGEVTSGAVASKVRWERSATIATLSFDLTTINLGRTEAIVPVRVSAGARVVGMKATIGGVAMVTQRLLRLTARAQYDTIVRRVSDPALLEFVKTEDGVDELSLSVFPLDKAHAAHITLTLELPSERPEWMTTDTVPHYVSAGTSLLAIEPAPIGRRIAIPGVTICSFGTHPMTSGQLDKTIIKRYVKRNLPRAKACYERALISNKTLTGTANLHFAIGEDGKTSGISVDGDLPSDDVRACIAKDIEQWEFPPVAHGGLTQINYPLTLVPSD
jgi:hypothetical protein